MARSNIARFRRADGSFPPLAGGDHQADDIGMPPLTLGRTLWAIREDALPRLIEAHRAGATGLGIRAAAAAPKAARRSSGQRAGGTVAVIPLTGVITPRYSFLSFLFGGGGGLLDFRDAFREAVVSPDVGAIVLEVDSPGGIIDLVPETAEEIREARGTKPIIAVANTCAASAAYWIACQADELVVTPSGDVGSVGVYMVHEDWSGWNDQQGVQPTYISAGKYKTEGNPDEPLSDDAKANWQQEVDDLYAMFVDAVAAGRDITPKQVRDGYGQGRTLLASRALAAGMVDRVATLEDVIAELLTNGSGGGATARAEARRAARLATTADEPEPEAEADADDQPRCSCGRFITDGEQQCPDCKAAAAAEETEPEPEAEVDDEPEPEATDTPSAQRIADVLFG
jgi:signal peptide peptidase SppA